MDLFAPKIAVFMRKCGPPVLGFVGLCAGWVWYAGRLDRELRALPDPERHALYERTEATLQSSCAQATGPAIGDYCREQAELLERFPECDERCRLLARAFLRTPAR